MYTRKVLSISKLALVLVLIYVIAKTAVPFGNTGKVPAPASAQYKAQELPIETRSPDLSLDDYAKIAERNLFGTSSQITGSGEWSLTPDSVRRSVSEELDLALIGTVSGSTSVARAVIKDLKTNLSGLYKTGQVVGNVRIDGIEANAVILFHNGKTKRLPITSWVSKNKVNNKSVASITTNNPKRNVPRNDPTRAKTTAGIQSKIGRVEEVLTKTVIRPHVVDGQTEGLEITGLENLNFANKFGLKNGDVIRTVNGHRLTSKQKAYQVFKKARTQKTVTFELLRNNKYKNISFALR